jgi:hypothetical protein
VTTSAPTLRSAVTAWQISASLSYMAKVRALRDSGRLKVMTPTPSSSR